MFALASIFVYYSDFYDDYDIWFHLAYGKQYIQNFSLNIDHSQFSWTPADKDWQYGTWFGSSVLYLAYSGLGFLGIVIVQWCVLAGIGVLYIYYLRRFDLKADFIIAISMITAVYISVNLTASIIKPELLSLLLFASFVFVCFYSKLFSKRLFYVLPLIFVLWVNTHGGFIIGLFCLTIITAGETLNHILNRDVNSKNRGLKDLLISTVLSYIALLLNPNGINYIVGTVSSLTSREYMADASMLRAYYSMWNYLFVNSWDNAPFRFVITGWSMILMFLIYCGGTIYLYIKNKAVDFAVILSNVLLFFLGMSMARATMFFPIFWLFSMSVVFYWTDMWNNKIVKGFSYTILCILCTVALYTSAAYNANFSWFGSKVDENVPLKETEFLRKNQIKGHIFNDYLIGGYLIWSLYPDWKVFIDPRYGPYVKTYVLKDFINLLNSKTPKESIKRLLEKYQPKIAVLHIRELPLILQMMALPDWRFVYFDKNAIIFLHKDKLSELSREAMDTDLEATRFKDVSNPMILARLFDLYANMFPSGSQPHLLYVAIKNAEQVLSYYKKNVRWIYAGKSKTIEKMEEVLRRKKHEFRQSVLMHQQQNTGNTSPAYR